MPHRTVLLDCLGTLLRLEPPAPRLAALTGMPLAEAERRMAAEIAHYRANLHRATDAAALAELRAECAAIAGCDVDTLLRAIVFTPFADVVPKLTGLRAAGTRLVVVSNWDVSLHEVLARTGLAPLLDGAYSSAEAGAAKPDPAMIDLALGDDRDAVLVGDSQEDEGAAAAAGIPFIHREDFFLVLAPGNTPGSGARRSPGETTR